MKNLVVIAHSGMKVNVYEDEWVILANGGKGCKVKVGWLHAAEMPNHDKDLILEVYICKYVIWCSWQLRTIFAKGYS